MFNKLNGNIKKKIFKFQRFFKGTAVPVPYKIIPLEQQCLYTVSKCLFNCHNLIPNF